MRVAANNVRHVCVRVVAAKVKAETREIEVATKPIEEHLNRIDDKSVGLQWMRGDLDDEELEKKKKERRHTLERRRQWKSAS